MHKLSYSPLWTVRLRIGLPGKERDRVWYRSLKAPHRPREKTASFGTSNLNSDIFSKREALHLQENDMMRLSNQILRDGSGTRRSIKPFQGPRIWIVKREHDKHKYANLLYLRDNWNQKYFAGHEISNEVSSITALSTCSLDAITTNLRRHQHSYPNTTDPDSPRYHYLSIFDMRTWITLEKVACLCNSCTLVAYSRPFRSIVFFRSTDEKETTAPQFWRCSRA